MEGVTFKRIRMALGFTGDELARRLNVSGNYIRLVETNKKPVSELLEYKIMDQLRVALESNDPLFSILKELLDGGHRH
ncbi:MAG TPA: helix-turn-helix transcriptional regulator [Candidatus Avisuccinivibrio pullicola]|nr:helix-turn-helix transcriptional regulator [Candidatus Avisuccinivibrio pullicola]